MSVNPYFREDRTQGGCELVVQLDDGQLIIRKIEARTAWHMLEHLTRFLRQNYNRAKADGQ